MIDPGTFNQFLDESERMQKGRLSSQAQLGLIRLLLNCMSLKVTGADFKLTNDGTRRVLIKDMRSYALSKKLLVFFRHDVFDEPRLCPTHKSQLVYDQQDVICPRYC